MHQRWRMILVAPLFSIFGFGLGATPVATQERETSNTEITLEKLAKLKRDDFSADAWRSLEYLQGRFKLAHTMLGQLKPHEHGTRESLNRRIEEYKKLISDLLKNFSERMVPS
ncbi:hypothetical protein ACFL3S_13460 [Gemmatimonadota bacterium]